MNTQVEQIIELEYQIGKLSQMAEGKEKETENKSVMEDIHGIAKFRNQKEIKKMNEMKYCKKFPELKEDERFEFKSTWSATREPHTQKQYSDIKEYQSEKF